MAATEATQSEVRQSGEHAAARLAALESTLETGLDRVSEAVTEGLAHVASALEWGFNAVVWQLEQQHETLRSIDSTLKTPTATQANEWRQMADELSARHAFARAEEFYTKAIATYPLDYRTYLGLASACLKTDQFERARAVLEDSIPHAPSAADFDWKSHSYRLLGHIQACDENYQQASRLLTQAVSLSPLSAEVHYDNALYKAHVGDVVAVEESLRVAISGSPICWRTAAVASDFGAIRPVVDRIRSEHLEVVRASHEEAMSAARTAIAGAETAIALAEEVNSRLGVLRPRPSASSWGPVALPFSCAATLNMAIEMLATAANANLHDYPRCLEAVLLANEARSMALRASEAASLQRAQLYARLDAARRTLRRERSDFISGWVGIGSSVGGIAWLVGGVTGCFARMNALVNDSSLASGLLATAAYPFVAFVGVGLIVALIAIGVTAIVALFHYAGLEPIPSTLSDEIVANSAEQDRGPREHGG